jgi:hypothetical protein
VHEGDPPLRAWLAARARQARNPPPPVLRAVIANVVVAAVGGVLLLAYELAFARGVAMPGGDLRTPLSVGYVALVIAAGTALTYLWVELPASRARPAGRSAWAGLLGFFASLPIAYLALVVVFQVLRPALD